MSDFYRYFKENMDGLGLPAPETLFGNLQMAVGNAAILLSHIDKFGKSVKVGELIGAGTRLERLGMIATLSATFYVGAIIGSIAVATGRTLSGGTSIPDALLVANRHELNRPWLVSVFYRAPNIFQRSDAGKKMLRFQAL